MLERSILSVRTTAPSPEQRAALRDQLKARLGGSVRRMTELGLVMATMLDGVPRDEDTSLIYASQFGESRALEGFLDSFPTASPTLFQTSIHPSGVQQGLIAQQQSWREFLPMAGGAQLAGQAVMAALVAPAPRVVLCGGEECGTWLVASSAASDRTFGFAVVLAAAQAPNALGHVRLSPSPAQPVPLPLPAWFEVLDRRQPFRATVLPGWEMDVTWS